jgi:hypothetical protein
LRSPRNARDTVIWLTCAACATSASVTRPLPRRREGLGSGDVVDRSEEEGLMSWAKSRAEYLG